LRRSRDDAGDADGLTDQVLDLDTIAGFEVGADHGFGPDPRRGDLPLGIVDIGEEDVSSGCRRGFP
jgi:hypothetical protein